MPLGDFGQVWSTLFKKHVNEAVENTMSLIFIRCLIDCFHPDPPLLSSLGWSVDLTALENKSDLVSRLVWATLGLSRLVVIVYASLV